MLNIKNYIFDFKLVNKYLILTILMVIIFLDILTVTNPVYCASFGMTNNKFYQLSLNHICDIYLPSLLGIYIIFVFSIDYKYNMDELLLSMSQLKINFYIIGKLIRIILLYMVIFMITFLSQWYAINKNIEIHGFYNTIPFLSSLTLSIPTSFFITALAFFLVTMLKKGVFAFLLFFSYIYAEIISKGIITKKLQIFINYYGINYDDTIIKTNRLILLTVGLLLFILAIKRTSKNS